MALVETLPEEDVPDVCRADLERLGYLPNYSSVFPHRPAAYAAWKLLNGAIKEAMDERRYELATVAAARRLGSSYCALCHGRVLADRFHTPAEVVAIARDHHAAGLDEVDVGSVTQSDVDRLHELGLSHADVVDAVLAASARCFFSKALDALGVQPDSAYRELEPALRDALTVGRPIAGD